MSGLRAGNPRIENCESDFNAAGHYPFLIPRISPRGQSRSANWSDREFTIVDAVRRAAIQPQAMTNNIATVDLSKATLMDSLTALAGVRSRGVTFYDGKGRPERLSYDELWQHALRFAAGLRKLKMAPGDPLRLDPHRAEGCDHRHPRLDRGRLSAGARVSARLRAGGSGLPPARRPCGRAIARAARRRRRAGLPVPRHPAAHLPDGESGAAIRRGLLLRVRRLRSVSRPTISRSCSSPRGRPRRPRACRSRTAASPPIYG